jgi:hypothetical protein
MERLQKLQNRFMAALVRYNLLGWYIAAVSTANLAYIMLYVH